MAHNRLMLFEEVDRHLSRKEAIKRALKETPSELSRDPKLLKSSPKKSAINLIFKAPRAFYRRLKKYTTGSKE